ncbi:hypothetical protein GCM10010413_56860 [Promicromonospora sukumoe]|uniref:EcsC family protein n=1 Tax=Promicromonospora sukumoe TaxID=88382 RepID=A0A7W3JCK2_9MICO|nr:hypothetical protein [Promicromonospora sukumoe]MBA8810338.1 hypothetical protein [Promicromonospora sukumoe]
MTDDKKLTRAESNGRATPGDALVKPDDSLHVTKADWLNYKPDGPLDHLVDRAVTIPSATIHKHVDKIRARNPDASPAEIVKLLEKEYLRVIQTTGSAVGAAAAIPAVGTAASVALSTSDVATFFASSAAFSLAIADVHGIDVQDVPRRRALLLATVLGDKGAKDVEDAIGGSGVAWGKVLLTSMPRGTLQRVNKALTHQFIKKQIAKQGSLLLGRILPFGIGAVVGLVGARALGHTVIAQSRAAFGPPPDRFPRVIEQK